MLYSESDLYLRTWMSERYQGKVTWTRGYACASRREHGLQADGK